MKNIIKIISKNDLEILVKESNTFREIFKKLNVFHPRYYKILRERLEKENIDFSHIPLGHNSNLGRNFNKEEIPLEQVLIENSTYSRSQLKKRLLKIGLLKNKCYQCGLEAIWNEEKLSLQIDHINGINTDNRIENLRILCPNCHTQTKTYSGKRNKIKKYCATCNKLIYKTSKKYCSDCVNESEENFKRYHKQRKIKDRPDKNILLKQINELGYVGTSKLYNVSDKTIKKWLK